MKKANSLTNQTITGLIWMFTGSGAQSIFRFIVLILLARLLSPSDFGIASATLVVITFSMIFSMLGVGPAIIQREKLNNEHITTGFTVSLILNISISLIIFYSSPIIASFFNIKELAMTLKVLSIVFIVQGFCIVAESLLQRNLKFRVLASIELVSYLTYGIFGVCLAIAGLSYWSLIIAHISQVVVKSILVLYIQPHSKKLTLDFVSFKELLYFGSGFSIGRIGNQVALQGDNFVIGKWLGTEALGLYSRAYQLIVMPANLFGQIMDKVLFPGMAKVQADNDKLALVYKRGISLVAALMLPISIMMIIFAKEITLILFGANWLGIVVPLQVLSAGLLFRTSYKISDSLVRAKGAVYKRAWRQYVYAGTVLIGSGIGQFWGIVGVSIGVLLAIFINFLLMADLVMKITSLKWKDFIVVHIRPLILTLAIGILSIFSKYILVTLSIAPILIIISTFISVGLVMYFILRNFPKLFLGEDIIWGMRKFNQWLPSKYQSKRLI